MKKTLGYNLITERILKELTRKGIVFLVDLFNAILRIRPRSIQNSPNYNDFKIR